MPSILILCRQLLVRRGLRQVLKEEFRDLQTCETKTLDEAEGRLSRQSWDLTVLGTGNRGEGGFAVLRSVRDRYPLSRLVVLDFTCERQRADRARRMGACGYISLDASRGQLVKAFETLLAGDKHFESLAPPVSAPPTAAEAPTLSPREQAVMMAISAGQRNGEIAARLQLSAKTVSTYRRRLLDKLQLSSTADVVRYVMDHQAP